MAGATHTILLVDDDDMVRDLVAATLRGGAYKLIQAVDGGQGLALAREHKPDLIFLDVNMPVMDGVSVCAELKTDPRTRGITVIMLTALGQDVDKDRAKRAGCGHFKKHAV